MTPSAHTKDGNNHMKLTNVFKTNKRTLSFEVFPPKNGTDGSGIIDAALSVAAIKPDFMSVTYGAGGGTSENTIPLAKKIKTMYGVETIAHQTCISSDKEQVLKSLQELSDNGIENILALRGDIPAADTFVPSSDFKYACDLIEFIKLHGDFCVGGACYPEGHVESDSFSEDLENLKHKVMCGCEFLTTQMFFDNDLLYRFLYRIRDMGIEVPVIAGVMPVTNKKQIKRICSLSGTTLPQRFISIVDKFGDSPEAMRQAGVYYAVQQVIDLYANGVNNVHIYSMNQPWIAEKIKSCLSDII